MEAGSMGRPVLMESRIYFLFFGVCDRDENSHLIFTYYELDLGEDLE